MADGFGKVACGADSTSGRSAPSSDIGEPNRLNWLLLVCAILGYAVVMVTQVATLVLCPGYPARKVCVSSVEEPKWAHVLDAPAALWLPDERCGATRADQDHDNVGGERSP